MLEYQPTDPPEGTQGVYRSLESERLQIEREKVAIERERLEYTNKLEAERHKLELERLALERARHALASSRISRFGPMVLPILTAILAGVSAIYCALISRSAARLNHQVIQLTRDIDTQGTTTRDQLMRLSTDFSQLAANIGNTNILLSQWQQKSENKSSSLMELTAAATGSKLQEIDGGTISSTVEDPSHTQWTIRPTKKLVSVTLSPEMNLPGTIDIRGRDKKQIASATLSDTSTGGRTEQKSCMVKEFYVSCEVTGHRSSVVVRFETQSVNPVKMTFIPDQVARLLAIKPDITP